MRRLLGFTLLTLIALVLTDAFSTHAQAQRSFDRRTQDRVCFYSDANYQGDVFCVNPGESTANVGGRFNDRISSIRISGRTTVTVFEDDNFGGARRTFNRDINNLRDVGWNDRITSFQVSGGQRGRGLGPARRGIEPRNGACFYTDEDFRGESICLSRGVNDRNVGEHFNDRISSIRVFGRARVTVFSDENFGGSRREFDRDVRNLRGLNDQITSIQVR